MRVVKANLTVDCILHTVLLILSYLIAGCSEEDFPVVDIAPVQSVVSVGYTYQRSAGKMFRRYGERQQVVSLVRISQQLSFLMDRWHLA